MLYPGKIYPETTLRLTVSFTDENGNAVDPTTVTFSSSSPGGTLTSYVYDTDDEVGKASTGNYYADIVPDESGRWHFRWKTTGSGTAIATEGDFIVQASKFAGDTWPYNDYGWC
jgi:hypothetical protein